MTDTYFDLEKYDEVPGNAVDFNLVEFYVPPGRTAAAEYMNKTQWEKAELAFRRATPVSRDRGEAGHQVQKAWHDRVQAVLDYAGVKTIDQFNYIAYADALRYKVITYEWLTDRIREHDIQRHKWESGGLRPDVLDMIDSLIVWRVGKT